MSSRVLKNQPNKRLVTILLEVIVVGGFLGSGKTTAVIQIGKHFATQGKRVGIIVNEIGEIGIDGDFISQYGLQTKEITAGCICCSLKVSLRETIFMMLAGLEPDIVIIESTGLAYPGVIRDEIMLMNLPEDFEMAPLLTLFDGSRFKQILKEIRKFAANQLGEAEVIAISKSDLVDASLLPIIQEAVHQINPKATIVTLSSKNQDSMDQMLRILEGKSSSAAPSKSIGKDGSLLMAGGAVVDSVAESGVGTFSTEYFFEDAPVFSSPDAFFEETVRDMMSRIQKKVLSQSPEFLGHIKLFFEVGDALFKISLTTANEMPAYDFVKAADAQPKPPALKVLSAVTGIEAADLQKLIQETVETILEEKQLPYIPQKS